MRFGTPTAALSRRPSRIVVAGASGAGKTTLAARIAVAAAVPHVEIDALYHGPGWVPRPDFAADVAALADRDAWVTEWQYAQARPVFAARAELLVWLDLPRLVVMRQVTGLTLRRRLRHQELWNGNTEPALRTVLTDRDHIPDGRGAPTPPPATGSTKPQPTTPTSKSSGCPPTALSSSGSPDRSPPRPDPLDDRHTGAADRRRR